MISRLRGELLEVNGCSATVDVGGVGYELFLPESAMAALPVPGEFVELRVRQVVREDGIALYGFFDEHERKLFDLLTGVNGCGPRIALSLIGQPGQTAVCEAILRHDAKSLRRAQGVGPKLAERIILELKEKIGEMSLSRRLEAALANRGGARPSADDPLVDALLALGYRRPEAESAAVTARHEADGVEEQLRVALRSLRK
jgi:Holliday junction DNA helicase RuvA